MSGKQYAEYEAVTRAAPEDAYRLIADVTNWPVLFGPCLHLEVLETGPAAERFRIWVTSGGNVRSWISRCQLDAQTLRMAFGQEDPAAPFASMSGTWRFEPLAEGTRIVLAYEWNVLGQNSEIEQRVREMLDRNGALEVEAARFWSERSADRSDLIFTVTNETVLDSPPDQVYDELQHKAAAAVQTIELDTETDFQSWRLAYKSAEPPRGLLARHGTWVLTGDSGRTRVSVQHDVALDPDAIEDVFGSGSTHAGARAQVTEALRSEISRPITPTGACVPLESR